MQVASNAFADAVKEIYEPDWVERDSLVNLFEVCMLCYLSKLNENKSFPCSTIKIKQQSDK